MIFMAMCGYIFRYVVICVKKTVLAIESLIFICKNSNKVSTYMVNIFKNIQVLAKSRGCSCEKNKHSTV